MNTNVHFLNHILLSSS